MPLIRRIGKSGGYQIDNHHYEQIMNTGKRKKGIDKSGNMAYNINEQIKKQLNGKKSMKHKFIEKGICIYEK